MNKSIKALTTVSTICMLAVLSLLVLFTLSTQAQFVPPAPSTSAVTIDSHGNVINTNSIFNFQSKTLTNAAVDGTTVTNQLGSVTVSGAGLTSVNGVYTYTTLYNGFPQYNLTGTVPGEAGIYNSGSAWIISGPSGGSKYSVTSTSPTPWTAGSFSPAAGTAPPAPSVTPAPITTGAALEKVSETVVKSIPLYGTDAITGPLGAQNGAWIINSDGSATFGGGVTFDATGDLIVSTLNVGGDFYVGDGGEFTFDDGYGGSDGFGGFYNGNSAWSINGESGALSTDGGAGYTDGSADMLVGGTINIGEEVRADSNAIILGDGDSDGNASFANGALTISNDGKLYTQGGVQAEILAYNSGNIVVNDFGVISPESTSTPPTYFEGEIYYDTAQHKLRVSGASSWETIASGWTVQSSNFTAIAGNRYQIDTSGGAITVTLPASASVGDTIVFQDAKLTWNTNNVTFSRNGLLINGGTSNYTGSVQGNKITATYISSGYGWSIK